MLWAKLRVIETNSFGNQLDKTWACGERYLGILKGLFGRLFGNRRESGTQHLFLMCSPYLLRPCGGGLCMSAVITCLLLDFFYL